jgi:lipopolysaccharide biosynthesis glycosyltransferase
MVSSIASLLVACVCIASLAHFGSAAVHSSSTVQVVFILERSTAKGAVTAAYSIYKSSAAPARLFFNFIVFDSTTERALYHQWNESVQSCFDTPRIRAILWQRPATYPLDSISKKGFDKDHIYARFYIPSIFPDISRFVYVDNDFVFNGDIAAVFYHPLVSFDAKRDESTSRSAMPERSIRSRPLPPKENAAVGFVADKAYFYKNYITTHFNMSHQFVRRAVKTMVRMKACLFNLLRNSSIGLLEQGEYLFINAGLFVVDAALWRASDLTAKAESIIVANRQPGNWMFSAANVGDQGEKLSCFG